jgi:hypothetical protein
MAGDLVFCSISKYMPQTSMYLSVLYNSSDHATGTSCKQYKIVSVSAKRWVLTELVSGAL